MKRSIAMRVRAWSLVLALMFVCSTSSAGATQSKQSQRTSITQNLALGATASSILLEPGYDYSPWRIFDNDPTTTWTEGVEGQGYGESLEIYTNQYAVITGGVIYPGYYKNEDLFLKNSAPRQLYIRTGEQEAYLDVTEYASNWYDNFGGYHFVFDEPMVSDGTVLVTIVAVRDGWKYADTCISELRFEGYQGTAADVPEVSQDHPRTIVARPADDMGVTLDQVTWTSDDPWAYPDMYSNPDGVGGDGLGPDELYPVDGDGLQFLDGGRSMMLAGFASALYKMHCGYANPEPKTILSKDLYSFSHAFMLYWYQYNVSDARIIPNGDYNLASEADLKAILQEMFTGVDEG